MHNSNALAEGVYVIESIIVDSKRGMKAPDWQRKCLMAVGLVL